MATGPRYTRPTAPVAFRLTEEARRILDYVVATTGGSSVSDYLRALVEADLARLGFRLQDGVHRALPLPLSAAELETWEVSDGRESGRAVG